MNKQKIINYNLNNTIGGASGGLIHGNTGSGVLGGSNNAQNTRGYSPQK